MWTIRETIRDVDYIREGILISVVCMVFFRN